MKKSLLAVCLCLSVLLSACGRESELGFGQLDVARTKEHSRYETAVQRLAVAGLRFSEVTNEIDAAFERQTALERPFLTHNTKFRALEEFVLAAHDLKEKFPARSEQRLPIRISMALKKIDEVIKAPNAADAPAIGFAEESLTLIAAEAELATKGLQLPANLGTGEVSVRFEGQRADVLGASRSLAQKLADFHKKHGRHLASPLVGKKAEALTAWVTAP